MTLLVPVESSFAPKSVKTSARVGLSEFYTFDWMLKTMLKAMLCSSLTCTGRVIYLVHLTALTATPCCML